MGNGGHPFWDKASVFPIFGKKKFFKPFRICYNRLNRGIMNRRGFYKEITMENQEEKARIIRDIVSMEWEMFQKVEGIGGRAGCQDQYPTFNIMRSSQFLAWDPGTLECYLQDLNKARVSGRNLITEKYAYMMESTDPEYYRLKLQPHLPPVNGTKSLLIQRILNLLIQWDQEVSREFPKLSQRGRPLEAAADKSGTTSVETYMGGELKTYSEETLQSLLDHLMGEKTRGGNVVRKILEFTTQQYGFAFLEDAEKKS